MKLLLVPSLGLALLFGCQNVNHGLGPDPSSPGAKHQGPAVLPDLAVARAPFHEVQVNWKERLAQPYAFLEGQGSYTGIGQLLEELDAAMRDQGRKPNGPPFALYYDDPGSVPVEQLRMRACFPVTGSSAPLAPVQHAILPSTTVVYAFVGGPYPEVPRSYPGLYSFMQELGWVESGPVREIYLVNPGSVASWDELVTEVQIPAANGR